MWHTTNRALTACVFWQVSTEDQDRCAMGEEKTQQQEFPRGHSRTQQWRRVKDMLDHMPEDAPDAVKRRMLARLQAALLPDEPSYDLQREVFLQHCASVGELSLRDASRSTKRPRETRSAVILSGAPGKKSKASFREYSAWSGCDVKSVKRHVRQRDETKVSGGELYNLIRQVEENTDKSYYELQGLEYWLKIADPRNLGNQKYNKVVVVCVACLLDGCVCRIK